MGRRFSSTRDRANDPSAFESRFARRGRLVLAIVACTFVLPCVALAVDGSPTPDSAGSVTGDDLEAASVLLESVANASSPPPPESIDQAFATARRALEREPASESSDRLRIRLCAARKALNLQALSEISAKISGRDGVQAPIELAAPVPTPPNVLRARMRGDQLATLKATIDADGCVTPERVVHSTSPEWASYSLSQVTHWVFRPAIQDAHPVATRYNLRVKYRRK